MQSCSKKLIDTCIFQIGVDLVDTQTRSASSRGATTFVDMFKGQLTAGEIGAIHNVSSDRDKYTLFFVIWSLKEAFIKAIGSGLGFDLTQVLHLNMLINSHFENFLYATD